MIHKGTYGGVQASTLTFFLSFQSGLCGCLEYIYTHSMDLWFLLKSVKESCQMMLGCSQYFLHVPPRFMAPNFLFNGEAAAHRDLFLRASLSLRAL